MSGKRLTVLVWELVWFTFWIYCLVSNSKTALRGEQIQVSNWSVILLDACFLFSALLSVIVALAKLDEDR